MNRLSDLILSRLPSQLSLLRTLKSSPKPVFELKVKHVISGLRGAPVLNWTSATQDPLQGLLIRGIPIEELVVRLPRKDTAPLPEGLLWFLLTARMPKAQELEMFLRDMRGKAELPEQTKTLVEHFPPDLPLLSKVSMGLMTMQPESHFARSYASKISKKELWKSCLEDSLTIIARLPNLLSYIYRGETIPEYLEFAQGIAYALTGKHDGRLTDVLRLIVVLLADGDGGSVSAHTSKAVASTLSDPYLSLSAGFNAVSGPRHGQASSQCLDLLTSLSTQLGHPPSDPAISTAIQKLAVSSKGTIPGFGHAVLSVPDKRFTILMDYMRGIAPSDKLLSLAERLQFIATEVLKSTKMRNPAPNVDLALAAALQAVGVQDSDLYPVIFALSRSLGILSNIVWDRALSIPLEYAVSVNLEELS